MAEMEKICVFDFCETLVDFQTANAFVDFVRDRVGTFRTRLWETIFVGLKRSRLLSVVERLTGYRFSFGKRLKLYQLKGIGEGELEAMAICFYIEAIHPHLIRDCLSELEKRKAEGWRIGLVSGGYGIYLKYFIREFQLDFLLSSDIAFSNRRCAGRLAGRDCMRECKVHLLNAFLGTTSQRSIAYSDSQSDLPLLLWAQEGIVVSRVSHQGWIDDYRFREIIWDYNSCQ